jgi:small basic protein
MLLQQTANSFTFTIGWVDIVILVILLVTFWRGRRLFAPIFVVVVMVYLVRIFPNEILAIIRGINQLNGPAAFITIGR